MINYIKHAIRKKRLEEILKNFELNLLQNVGLGTFHNMKEVKNMEKEKMDRVTEKIKKDFPGDHALQEVHMARKILSSEAKEKKIRFWEYIKMQVERVKH